MTPEGSSEKNSRHSKMMSSGEPCAVAVQSDSGKTSRGEVRLKTWDRKEGTRRALRFWLYCWILSLLSVALPVLHFLLVPGFFIAGPFGAWIVSTQGSSILGGETTCPDCGTFLPISAGPDTWPLRDLCAGCQNRMKIEKA